MKRSIRLGLAAALLAGSSLTAPAFAQQAPAQPQPQQETQKLPSANSAQQQAPGQTKQPGEPATQMAPGQKQKSGAAGSAAEAAPGQTKPMKQDAAAGDATAPKTQGQAADTKAGDAKPSGKAADMTDPAAKPGAGQADAQKQAPAEQMDKKAEGAEKPASGQNQATGEQKPSGETTASVNISTEQRTEIRTIIQETKVQPARLDVAVNVGVVVPATVEFHPLPPRIVEIVPRYRGYEYFVLADGRIVIVEPGTHEVVYIIVA